MASENRPASGPGYWPDEVRVAGFKVVPPDPGIMQAIGLNYALEAAVADLVDNSIDADATDVLVRFIRNGARISNLCVVDNGCGMDEAELEHAMTLGRRRDYDPDDLGHFGQGLKAASLGRARSLTVITRAAGSRSSGMRWLKARDDEFTCDIVQQDYAEMLLNRAWGPVSLRSGTVIRWDGVKDFPAARDATTTDNYIETIIPRLRNHLGLVFHRLIADEAVSITVDVEDTDAPEAPSPQPVTAIDPFGYPRSGRPDYPKALPVQLDSATVELRCHLWPPRSERKEFKTPRTGDHLGQGFYFYRNDRLVQAGGWNGVIQPERRFQLARVEVDVDDRLVAHLQMNPEKTHIDASEAFIHAVEVAQSGEFDLRSYCENASTRLREARKKAGTRRPVVPPGRGFAPAVREAIGSELEFLPGAERIDITWMDFNKLTDSGPFFRIDWDNRQIWLDKRYRWAVTGDRGASLNDAPLLKAALYLLLNNLFEGEHLGARQKDNVELWGTILAAAAQAESE